jgi:twitching motility two-component system response regulator PilG
MAWSQTLRDGIAATHARQFEQARPLLEKAIAETPGSAPAWYWSALASATPTDAIGCLRRVIDLDPSQTTARDALGKLLVVSAVAAAPRDPAGARGLLAEASQVAPHVDAVWIALSALGDSPADRLDALRRAVRLAPHRKELRARLHEMLVRDAVAAARAGTKPQARALFREAAENDPRDVRVWQALAKLADNRTEAIQALRELVRLAPGQPAHHLELKATVIADARALQLAGKKREAERRWREAIALDGRDVEPLLGLAATAGDQADVRRAVEHAQRLEPSNEKVLAWLAKLNAAPSAPAAAPHTAAAKRTVMVVDDSPTIRKIVALTLERAGYAVVAEPDGESAVGRLTQLVPDLILLDITMPKLDGYEVCKRIKEDPRTAHVPVVMLSGKDGFFDKVKGRMVGATEYLTKPFQAPAVLKVIASHCRPGPEVAHG